MYLWGKSGHIQSAFFSILGRFGKKEVPNKKRFELIDKDGAIISYDLFYREKGSQKVYYYSSFKSC